MKSFIVEINLFAVDDSHLCSGRRRGLIEYEGCTLDHKELKHFLDTARIYLTLALAQRWPNAAPPKLTGFD